MKKMIAMLCAIATGFFAFGDAEVDTPTFQYSATGFETSQGYEVGNTISNLTVETGSDDLHWFLETGADDESGTVKAYETAPADNNLQYLEVETGALPLYRTVAKHASDVKTLEAVTAVDIDTGIFFDADVKFTPGAEAPTLAEGAKFAVWAIENEPANEGDPMTTNLMVTAGQYTPSGIVPVTFTLATPANFDFSAWHRLTIRAIKEVTAADAMVSGFVVFVDGVEGAKGIPLAATDADYATKIGLTAVDLKNGPAKFFNAQQLFLSAATIEEANQELKVVGLQGSGAIDNFQITDYENAPIFARDEIQVTVNFDADAVSTFKMKIGEVEIPAAKIDKTVEGKWVATVDGMTPAVIVSDIELSDTTKMVTNYDKDGKFIKIEGAALEDPTGNMIVTETIGFVVDEKNYPAGETGFAAALAAAQLAGVPLVLASDFTWNVDDKTKFAGIDILDDTVIDLAGNDVVFMGEQEEAGVYSKTQGFWIDDGVELKILDSVGGGAVKAGGTFDAALVCAAEGGAFVLGEDGAGDAGATIDGAITDADGDGTVTLYKGYVSNVNDGDTVKDWVVDDSHEAVAGEGDYAGFWVIQIAGAVELKLVDDANATLASDAGVGQIAKNTDVTVTATPATGYEYATTPAGWEAGDNGTITTNFTITADTTVTAPAPTQIEYKLMLNVAANTTLTADKAAPYHYNDVVVITAAPDAGYEFATLPDGWFEADAGAATNTVTITDDTEITGPAATAIAYAAWVEIGGVTQKFRDYNDALAAIQAAEAAGTYPINVTIKTATENFPAGTTINIDATGWAIIGNANLVGIDIAAGKTVEVVGTLTYGGTVAGTLFATTITAADGAITLAGNGKVMTGEGASIAAAFAEVEGFRVAETADEESGFSYELVQQFAVTFVNESVTVGVTTVDVNTAWADVEKPADPVKEGWTFTGWADAPATVTEDVTVTARFSQDAVTFTVKAIEGATLTKVEKFVDPDWVDITDRPFTVAPGTQVKLTYEAEEGYDLTAETFTKTVSEAGEIDASGTILPVLKTYVAQIGDDKYETLAAAFAEVEDGETIELLANYTLPAVTVVTVDTTDGITLDLGGFTLTAPAGAWGGNYGLTINGTKLTIENGTISGGQYAVSVVNGADVTLAEDAMISTTGQFAFLVDCATYTTYGTNTCSDATGLTIFCNGPTAETVINVEDGALVENTTRDSGVAIGAYGATPVINLYGGKLKGCYAIEASAAATVNLVGGIIEGYVREEYYGALDFDLTDDCGTLFTVVVPADPTCCKIADLCAEGYAPKEVTGGWMIAKKSFTVIFENAADDSATIEPVAGVSNLVWGTELTITATAATGYEYAAESYEGWTKEENGTLTMNVTVSAAATFTAPTATEIPADLVTFTVKAIEGATLSTVATNAGEDVWVTITEPYTVEKGASVKLTFAPAAGYTLETTEFTTTVSTDGAEVDAGETIKPAKMGFAIIIAGEPATTNYYATLAEAFGAVADGGTVTLLDNATVSTESALAKANLEGTGITLDLNGKKLTVTVEDAINVNNTKLTIVGGEIEATADTSLDFCNGSVVTLAAGATITQTDATIGNTPIWVAGATFNVYGTVLATNGAPGLFMNSGTVNVNEGGVVANRFMSDDGNGNAGIWTKGGVVNVNGGTVESSLAYALKLDTANLVVTINSGVINGVIFGNATALTPLTDACTAKFNTLGNEGSLKLADLCAAGYEPVKVGGEGEYKNYYQIAIKKFDVTFKAEGATDIVSNDVAYGTAFADVKPADPTAPTGKSFKGWTPVVDKIDGTELTFTAEFTNNVYTITFAANGGEGTQTAIEYAWGDVKTAPECTFTAPTDGTFNCWSNATSHATYAVGATLPTECESYELVADWTITAPTPAYPSYIDVDDDTVKGQWDAWKAGKEIGDVEAELVEEAFLLNCAPTVEAVAAAKETFKFTEITVDAEGNVSFKVAGKTAASGTGLEGYNGYLVIKGKATLDAAEWHDKTTGDQFFQATLVPSLKK